MKKTLVLCSTFVLMCGIAWADEEAAPNDAQSMPASQSDQSEPEPCLGKSVEDILAEFKLDAEKTATPPCPVQTVCSLNGGTFCSSSTQCGGQGASSFSDTGERRCNGPGSPPPFQCPQGQTIHIETKSCRVCPCCTQGPPFCVCLVPPTCTGSVVVGFACQ